MPSTLTVDEHLAVVGSAGRRLVDTAVDAGLDAPVPTCPEWTAAALLAHVTTVHRWATAHVRGGDPDAFPDETVIRAEVADLAAHYRDGLAGLLAALRAAPEDLRAMTFLEDAPAPRAFWARRQAHETTIHMVDALAAAVGRPPTVDEAGIERDVAVDGIDELLRGFFTRGRSKLHDGTTYTVVVDPSDADRRWTLRVDERLTVDPGDGPGDDGAAVSVTGTAAALYLALWNRGDEIDVAGRSGLLDRWRSTQRVGWS